MPEIDLITEISLNLDKQEGIAEWYFQSIDPATGELTKDPLAGFLPPNDDKGSGQGFVMFKIKLKEGLADDVVVANRASIVFDYNEPIITPEWVNTRDVVPPTSAMLTPSNVDNGQVTLKWGGTDNSGGSGVYCYDVYMKQNNNEYYEMIFSGITETTAQVEFDAATEYTFYTLATDHAGNREPEKDMPDISWKYTGIKTLEQNLFLLYPNPANTECTIELNVEKPGNVIITLSNILGANVMKIYDGFVENGRLKHTFDIRSLPPGIYTALINTGAETLGEKLLIIR
jgi:hypothetical protein